MSWWKLSGGLLLVGTLLWGLNQIAESRIADAREKADSLAVEESAATARADSLAAHTNALERRLVRLDSISRRDSLRLARTETRNARLVDSLSSLSSRLGSEAQASGARFDSVWTRLAEERPSPKLDTLRAAHKAQVTTLRAQVEAERERAFSNRGLIEKQRAQIATLRNQVALRDTVIQSLHGETAELRTALSTARERAEHWRDQADPGLFVSIGRDLEKYAAALAIGAAGGALLSR